LGTTGLSGKHANFTVWQQATFEIKCRAHSKLFVRAT